MTIGDSTFGYWKSQIRGEGRIWNNYNKRIENLSVTQEREIVNTTIQFNLSHQHPYSKYEMN